MKVGSTQNNKMQNFYKEELRWLEGEPTPSSWMEQQGERGCVRKSRKSRPGSETIYCMSFIVLSTVQCNTAQSNLKQF